jgi:hypothetical protein
MGARFADDSSMEEYARFIYNLGLRRSACGLRESARLAHRVRAGARLIPLYPRLIADSRIATVAAGPLA